MPTQVQDRLVKIALISFALSQFNKFWIADLGGVPVGWFSTSWTLYKYKQHEKFQGIMYNIPTANWNLQQRKERE
ncbi:hypothetical protein RhiirA5_438020 [Rhizophagus irregularis]|uniref:Uncharacterized protein n=1 Tax=Rhizophagus irregularis TaxID=588596 RepID=A0A2N0NJP7_9GLOM|nr:hypothetical protein RhiirA5_438020 [Rhizophagus irregularis]